MEREKKTIYSFSYGAQALAFNLLKTEVKIILLLGLSKKSSMVWKGLFRSQL